MSETKLSKYLQKTVVNVPAGPRLRIPVILSDSKGFSLRNQITHPFDNNIVWWCKKGAKIEGSLAWLKRNIDRNLQNLGDIALYVWLGTCNLTSKDKSRFISLSSQNNETIDHIIRTLLEFKRFLTDYTQVKLVFLEVPIYSLKNWNEHCKHKDPSTFKDQDKQLQVQIFNLNKEIRKLNLDLNTNSPDFSAFLKANCRHRTRSRHDTWHYYNFNLYLDGIHPGRNLARVWLREISDRIRTDCWN
jgi:hypothetical protein